LQKQRASEWHQDSRKGLWRAFIAGLMMVVGITSQALQNNDLKDFM